MLVSLVVVRVFVWVAREMFCGYNGVSGGGFAQTSPLLTVHVQA